MEGIEGYSENETKCVCKERYAGTACEIGISLFVCLLFLSENTFSVDLNS